MILCKFIATGLLFWVAVGLSPAQERLRPPATPLLTSDPYFSVWSEADHATDDVTRHWTKHPHPLVSLIKIDGQNFRILGDSPQGIPPLPQLDLTVTPTKTTYFFGNSQVEVRMSFLSPSLPSNLDVFARPLTYLRWDVASLDGQHHRVQIYESTSSLLSVENPSQPVTWSQSRAGDLTLLRAGTEAQDFLKRAGDDTRIDWGYVYAAAKTAEATHAIGGDSVLKAAFLQRGSLSGVTDIRMPRPPSDAEPVLGFSFDLRSVDSRGASRTLMLAYDEIYSIDYFGKRLRPYWRRGGAGPEKLFADAERDQTNLEQECAKFDRELMEDAQRIGGERYAQILALSYRECIAANALAADAKGMPLLLTKENTSNGDIATVDVIFPMDPVWILLSPTLAKASLVSNFMYAASPHWKFPNAPHDLGTYPLVFGRDDGGEGMPVEESGNMILLTDAVAHDENSPEFANQFWPQLTIWAHYLEQYGLDPEDQLCTDDFMGHLAHNANLSVKAILALAAYGDLCKMRGDSVGFAKYASLAKADAAHWMEVADAGDHSLLAFDKPNTWSQKYNMVWDQILGLNVFPVSVREREVAYYRQKMLRYGVPLDSRTRLTKTDWSIWSAALATNPSDFRSIVAPIFDYLNATTARDPIADSYVTDRVGSGGMHARPVVGGFFVQMLNDPAVWHKWASRDHAKSVRWAPLPLSDNREDVVELIATGRTGKPLWRYTVSQPPSNWMESNYDDSPWSTGVAGFGTDGTPAVAVGTKWDKDDIWMRREVVLPKNLRNIGLLWFHDEDIEVYIDGVLAAQEPGFLTRYETAEISPEALKRLKPGAKVVVAVHCHQTTGGQGVDVGFVRLQKRSH